MSKRVRLPSASVPAQKKPRTLGPFTPNKIATAEAAATVDADPPLPKLIKAVNDDFKTIKGKCVVHWMRMGDLRSMYCSPF
jgi:deoxyribodipyrimidine photo-lyase